MTTKVRYTQPLFRVLPGSYTVATVPGVDSVLIRRDGVACDIFADSAGAALDNPIPLRVAPGEAGLSTLGELVLYLEAGNGYDGVATVGGSVSVFVLGDISPDPHDVVATPDAGDAGYDVVILAGQSNMRGGNFGPIDTVRYDAADPRVWQWPAFGADVGLLETATEPLSHPGSGSVGIGPGLSFAKWYAGWVAPNRRVLLVPAAVSSTALVGAGAAWNVETTGPTSLFAQAVSAARAAMAAAAPNARVSAVLWSQGETDALGGSVPVAGYQAALDALIDAFQAAFPGSLFVLAQMAPDFISAHPPYAGQVDGIHIDTPRRKVGTGFAYGPTVATVDGTHYTAAAQREIGRRLFAALARARLNVLGTPPVATATVSLVQSGTSILLTWDQPLGRVTDFVVQHRPLGAGAWTTLARPSPDIDAAATIAGTTNGESYEVRVFTLNEAGTSAASAATIATVSIPAQVVGLAAGSPTSTTVPLTWTATPEAATYLVEYKAASSGTWGSAPSVTTNAATVSLLGPLTAYDFRVSALNGAGTGAASTTVTATTAPVAPLVDTVGVAAARGYSVRRLRAAYAGSALRVRRSSDDTESDVGFIAGGDLDATALLSFCGAGDGYVVTIYDQSGNGLDLTQPITTKQAKLVTTGVLHTLNGRPVLLFDGVDDIYTDASPGMWAAGEASVLAVAKVNLPLFASGRLVAESRSSTTNGNYSPFAENGTLGFLRCVVISDAFANIFIGQSAAPSVIDQLHSMSWVDTGALASCFVDGSAAYTPAAYSRATVTVTLDRFSIGGNRRAADEDFAAMSLSEMVVFYEALDATARQTGEVNQQPYFSTP